MSATASLVAGSSRRVRMGRPSLVQVPAALVAEPSAATSSLVNPRPRKAATALRDMANPAPISPSSGLRSRMVTSQPVRLRLIAAESPAIPAPTTTAVHPTELLLTRSSHYDSPPRATVPPPGGGHPTPV